MTDGPQDAQAVRRALMEVFDVGPGQVERSVVGQGPEHQAVDLLRRLLELQEAADADGKRRYRWAVGIAGLSLVIAAVSLLVTTL